MSRARAAGVAQYKLSSLWDALLTLASALGTHAAFLATDPSPASGVSPLLRDAWDSLVGLARHWTGTAWPSVLPRLLEHLLMSPRNFVGCCALLRDLLPSNHINDSLGIWPTLPLPAHYSYDDELLSSQLQSVADTLAVVSDIFIRTAVEELHCLIGSILTRVCARSLNVACAMLVPMTELLRDDISLPMLQRLLRLIRVISVSAHGKLVLLSLDVVPVLMSLLDKYTTESEVEDTVWDITFWLCEVCYYHSVMNASMIHVD